MLIENLAANAAAHQAGRRASCRAMANVERSATVRMRWRRPHHTARPGSRKAQARAGSHHRQIPARAEQAACRADAGRAAAAARVIMAHKVKAEARIRKPNHPAHIVVTVCPSRRMPSNARCWCWRRYFVATGFSLLALWPVSRLSFGKGLAHFHLGHLIHAGSSYPQSSLANRDPLLLQSRHCFPVGA